VACGGTKPADERRDDADRQFGPVREEIVEHHLFAIVEGRVRVERAGRVLLEQGPGSTVGELAVLVPEPRSASVIAVEPTVALRITKPVLDDLLSDWPELAVSVISALVGRLRATAGHEIRTDP
jgi:CRP-like cAMP-binding protein